MKLLNNSFNKTQKNGLAGLVRSGLIVGILFTLVSAPVSPLLGTALAACTTTAPPTTYGKVTQTVNVATAGTYRVWSRIKAPDTTANSYYFQADTGCYHNVGDAASIPANSWTWVNYEDGTATTKMDITLTAGVHTLTYIGKEANVQLDRILLLGDLACVPTGTGDNCATVDVTPPTVSVTAPASGTTVSNTVNVTASATDASGVTKVEFYVDGSLKSTDTTSAYSYAWDSKTVANGSHTIQAKAYDTPGNTASSINVTVTVNNTVATTGPDLVVTNVSWAPASPATGGQVTFSATVQNIGDTATPVGIILGVAFSVDGQKVNWSDNNTTSLAPGASRVQTANGGPTGVATWTATTGTHTVLASVDDSNRIVESNDTNNTKSGTLTPGTPADTTAPTVSITAPASGSSVASGTSVTINATASDNVGVAKVEFYIDGLLKTSDTTSPYSYTWSTTGVPAGAHPITTKAYDAAGNVTTSTAVSVSITTTNGGGDVNGDSRVNALDLSALISHDGQNYPAADFNHDGTVGAADMAILLAKWTW